MPGVDSLLQMTRVLLAERMPPQGRVLVVGAGGGLELEDLAKAHTGWQFDGVDPSAAMLDLAARRLGPLTSRVTLHEGYVQDAPAAPFDGATCLPTFHFVPETSEAMRFRAACEPHTRCWTNAVSLTWSAGPLPCQPRRSRPI